MCCLFNEQKLRDSECRLAVFFQSFTQPQIIDFLSSFIPHLSKVTAITVINPVNLRPERECVICTFLFNLAGN